ncbi:hypothetical protein ACF1A5_11405 [Streptomyces sp. NPDC014864]|uniref:hypothetical protein n=1 Tax=Streptomyces sp. NPDC014864 TaxID=3364924 RepID=UPI0036F993A2
MRKRDRDALGGIAFGVVLVVFVIVGTWVRVSAPCSSLGWLPVKDVPARCLMGAGRR